MSIAVNTWKDYKITICSTLTAAAAATGLSYLIPEIKGTVEHAVTIGLPTITSLILGAIADRNRKQKEKLETILYSTDQAHDTGVVSLDTRGTVKNFIAGRGKVFENLNFRAKPGENISTKYSELSPEVAEFFETAITELVKRRDESEKDPAAWKKFNSKAAYDDEKKGRCIKNKNTFGNEFIKTTYELEAFLGEDNKTVKIKARRLVDDTGLEALSAWADKKVVEHIRRNPEAYKTPAKAPTACLYCDIRGSTRFGDTHTAEEVRNFTNLYYSSLLSAASEFDFTFDKFVGDEILILFGPPYDKTAEHSSMKTPVYNAINAAIKMRASFQEIKGNYDIGLGIGIDFGTPYVGIYGGGTRKQFTGMGKTFNQGARVCSAAKDKEILITHFTYEQLMKEREFTDIKGIESLLEDSGSIDAKGVSKPLKIYRVRL